MFENKDKIFGRFQTKMDRRGRSRLLRSRAGLHRVGVLDMRNFIMKYYVTLYLTRKDTDYRAQLMKKNDVLSYRQRLVLNELADVKSKSRANV